MSEIVHTELKEMNRRLGVVITLLLRLNHRGTGSMTLRSQIQALKNLGLRPIEIAEALGKTQSYINKELAALKKGAVKNV